MKLTVVGYWGAYPEVDSATAGYLLQKDTYTLLIDCGSGVISKLQNYVSIAKLNAVIVSHYHHDHVADIGPLQYARMIKTTLGECTEPLAIYGHSTDKEGFSRLSKEPYTKAVAYYPNKSLEIGPFSISFLKTDHPATCYAMKITDGSKTIVYTADSSYKEEFISFSKDADLLISECSFYAHQNGKNAGHMNSYDAATIAERAKAKQLLLTHLPHFGNHASLAEQAKEKYTGDIQLAKSGWIFRT